MKSNAMFPPLAANRPKRARGARFGQRTTDETPTKEQKNTLAIAIALAAAGYLVLKYAERY